MFVTVLSWGRQLLEHYLDLKVVVDMVVKQDGSNKRWTSEVIIALNAFVLNRLLSQLSGQLAQLFYLKCC